SWLAPFETPRVSYRSLTVAIVLALRGGRDDYPGRPEDAVAQAVALLEHLQYGALLGLGRLREQRLVDVRVERPVGVDLGETLAIERRLELAVHQPNALFELRLLVLLGRGQRPLEVVEHRQELLHQP